MNLNSTHDDFMSYAAKSKLSGDSENGFIGWVCHYLEKQLRPSQVSVLLYDDALESYAVRASIGRYRIPPSLIRLDHKNCLIQLLEQGEPISPYATKSKNLVSMEELLISRDTEASLIIDEMKRHRIEVCVKIQSRDERVFGYLLVGPQEGNHPYTDEDISFFMDMAEDIACDVERRDSLKEADEKKESELSTPLLHEEIKNWQQKVVLEGGQFGVLMLGLEKDKKKVKGDELSFVLENLRHEIRQLDFVCTYKDKIVVLLGMNSSSRKGSFDIQDFRYQAYQVVDRIRQSVPCGLQSSMGLTFMGHKMKKNERELLREAKRAFKEARKMEEPRFYILED